MRASLAAPFLAIAAFAASLPASAQDFYSGNVQSALSTASVSSLNITRSDIVNDELRQRTGSGHRGTYYNQQAPAFAAVSSPRSASFRPTSDVTTEVNSRFIDMMSRGQPDKRDEIARALDSGAFLRTFDGLMSSYNFDSLNLADVMAAYYIVMWEVVHDQVPTRDEILGTRNQILSGLAGKPELARMANAQKQEAAETLKLLSAMALTSYEDFKRRGDLRGLSGFQNTIRSSTQRQGIDLAQLAITDRGFMPR